MPASSATARQARPKRVRGKTASTATTSDRVRATTKRRIGVTITVKGPANLFEQLKSHFDHEAPVFRHVEMQDVDLTVEFGDTVLVTRLAAWADTVRKVLA